MSGYLQMIANFFFFWSAKVWQFSPAGSHIRELKCSQAQPSNPKTFHNVFIQHLFGKDTETTDFSYFFVNLFF